MDNEYLTEHWLFNQKDEFDLFIEECRRKLNEGLGDAQRRTNCGIPSECNK